MMSDKRSRTDILAGLQAKARTTLRPREKLPLDPVHAGEEPFKEAEAEGDHNEAPDAKEDGEQAPTGKSDQPVEEFAHRRPHAALQSCSDWSSSEAVVTPENFKTCKRCDTVKHRGEFPKSTAYRDGLNSWCHACHSAYFRERKSIRPRKPGYTFSRFNANLVQGIMARHGIVLHDLFQRAAWDAACRDLTRPFHEALEDTLVKAAKPIR